jgi:hypothetical protein
MTDDDGFREEAARRRRSRSLMLALVLGAFVVLLYFITIARIGSQ